MNYVIMKNQQVKITLITISIIVSVIILYRYTTTNIEEQKTNIKVEETKVLLQEFPKAIETRHKEAERRIESEHNRIKKEVSSMEMDELVDALNIELNEYIDSTSTMEESPTRTYHNSK